MFFLNPIEILELNDKDLEAIDSNLIKKAKKRLFADIELSDYGSFDYLGNTFSKSEVENSINQLENPDLLEIYYFVSQYRELQNFLSSSDTNLFKNFRREGIFILDQVINFISPYYANSLNKVILGIYLSESANYFKDVVSEKHLLTIQDQDRAFKSLEVYLKQKIQDIDDDAASIRNKEGRITEQDISILFANYKSILKSVNIKVLPLIFQSLKNDCALAIRSFSNNAYNNFDIDSQAASMLQYALTFGADHLTDKKIRDDFEEITNRINEKLVKERHAPLLKDWAATLKSLNVSTEGIENKTIQSSDFDLTILTKYLSVNDTPIELIEIRDQIALSLRSLSISIWNKHSDIKKALAVMDAALKIKTSVEVNTKLLIDKQDLINLQIKYKDELYCWFCETNLPNERSLYKRTIYKETYRSRFPKKVQFSYKDVGVPRCTNCGEIHSKGTNTLQLIAGGCTILGAVIGYFADEHFIIGGIIGLIIGLILGNLRSEEDVKKSNIKSTGTISSYPPVQALLIQGWTFNKPSA
jgi:hypothetical protein